MEMVKVQYLRFFTNLSSCKCFSSLSSNSLLRLETSQRSMSLSVDTFSNSARSRTTSLVKSMVAILTAIDNHNRHSTSLISEQTNGVHAFSISHESTALLSTLHSTMIWGLATLQASETIYHSFSAERIGMGMLNILFINYCCMKSQTRQLC